MWAASCMGDVRRRRTRGATTGRDADPTAPLATSHDHDLTAAASEMKSRPDPLHFPTSQHKRKPRQPDPST